MFRKCFILALLVVANGLVANQPQWSFETPAQGWNCPYFVQKYFHNSELQTQWAFELMGRYPLTDTEEVLDFGCGDGKLTALFSRFVGKGKITGVDLSAQMIHFAQLKFPSYAYPNLEFQRSNSLDFSDWDEKLRYDKIMTFCTLHLVKDPEQVLKNLKAHLKADGQLLAVVPAGGNPELFSAAGALFQELGRDIPWTLPTNGPSLRTLDGCRVILANAGYEIDLLEKIDTDIPFVSKKELLDWLIGTTGPNWSVAPKDCPLFLRRVVEGMLALDPKIIDDEGRIHFKMSRIMFVAHLRS